MLKPLFGNRSGILAIAAILYGGFMIVSAKHQFGGNPSGFLFVSPVARCPEVYYDGLIVRDDSGYDGQFFYYIGVDPFVKQPSLYQCTRVDAYRYQRILFPLLSHVIARGKKEALPWVMPGVNLAGILMGTYFLMMICKAHNRNISLALLYAFSTGCIASLARNTCEPLYLAFIILAIYFYWVKNNLFLTALALLPATFSKELALGSAGIILLYELIKKRNFKTSWVLLVPFAAYFMWQLHIKNVFANFPIQVTHASEGAILRSFQNFFAYYWHNLSTVDLWHRRGWIDLFLQSNFIVCVGILIIDKEKLVSPLPWIGILFALLVIAFSFPPNGTDYWGYGRHTAEVFLCALLTYIRTDRKVYRWPLALNFVTFLLIFISLI